MPPKSTLLVVAGLPTAIFESTIAWAGLDAKTESAANARALQISLLLKVISRTPRVQIPAFTACKIAREWGHGFCDWLSYALHIVAMRISHE
jgi:hypothetical protein